MAQYQRRVNTLGLGGIVRFAGRLSPQEAHARAATADVLLTIDAGSDGASLFLPSKLVEYLPLRKPILGLTPLQGPTADLLRRLAYPVVAPGDVDGLVTVLSAIVEAHSANRLGPSIQHDEVARDYDIRETTTAFERVLDDARGSG